jgi:hypothetical protein
MRAWERMQRTKGWFGGFYPEQYPDPFPTFAAPTDSFDWGVADGLLWVNECDPPAEEIHALYAEVYDRDSVVATYEDGVESALFGRKGAGMDGLDLSPGVVTVRPR